MAMDMAAAQATIDPNELLGALQTKLHQETDENVKLNALVRQLSRGLTIATDRLGLLEQQIRELGAVPVTDPEAVNAEPPPSRQAGRAQARKAAKRTRKGASTGNGNGKK